MLTVDIVGLRALNGRFASVRDHGLLAIQLEEAGATAKVVEDIYRRRAPRGQKLSTDTPGHFFEGIHAHAGLVGTSVEMEVTTNNPKLRGWLAEGTGVYAGHGRIYPKRSKALGPIRSWTKGGGSGPFFFRSIAGMKAQPWEQRAADEAAPFIITMGNRIGHRVVLALAI
jgi:hypothetical protein